MQNLFVSYMRTLVPYGVALVLTGTGWLGIPVDSTTAAGAVSLGLGAAYYAAFRGLEELAERMAWQPLQTIAGIFLGWAKPPQYVAPITAPLRLKLKVDTAVWDESLDKLRHILDDGGPGTR